MPYDPYWYLTGYEANLPEPEAEAPPPTSAGSLEDFMRFDIPGATPTVSAVATAEVAYVPAVDEVTEGLGYSPYTPEAPRPIIEDALDWWRTPEEEQRRRERKAAQRRAKVRPIVESITQRLESANPVLQNILGTISDVLGGRDPASNLWEQVQQAVAPQPYELPPYRLPSIYKGPTGQAAQAGASVGAGSLEDFMRFDMPGVFPTGRGGGDGAESLYQYGRPASPEMQRRLYGMAQRPELAVPDRRYEIEGTEAVDRYGRPVGDDYPGPGPTSGPPEGMEWAIRWNDSPTGGGAWDWTLVPEGETSRGQVDPTAPALTPQPGRSGTGYGGGYTPYAPTTTTTGGSGRGGGGGVSGPGYDPLAPLPEEPPKSLGELSWWGPDAVTPLLKGWAGWMRELVEINAESRPIPFPFDFDELSDISEERRATLDELERALSQPEVTTTQVETVPAAEGEVRPTRDEDRTPTAPVPVPGTTTTEPFAALIQRTLAGSEQGISTGLSDILRELTQRRERGASTLGYIEQLIDESQGEGVDARPFEALLKMAQSGEGEESTLDQLLNQYAPYLKEWDTSVPLLKTPKPGVGSVSGVLNRLQGMLGVDWGEDASQTEKWQQLINKIPGASFEAQQLMHSLTFDQSGKWMTQSSSMLPNPAFT